MAGRTLSLALLALLVLGAGACTRFESTYLRKVGEADNLAKQLSALQGRYRELSAENDALKAEAARLAARLDATSVERNRLAGDLAQAASQRDRLKEDLAETAGERDRFMADNRELDKVLKAKSDSLTQTIADLRGKVSQAEGENARLQAQVAGLERQFAAQQRSLADRAEETARFEKENARLRQDVAALRRSQEETVQKSRTYEDLLRKMKDEIDRGQMTITELKGKLTLNMVDAILFDTGKAEIKPEGEEILRRVVSILKDVRDKSIRIEGHTDNVQIIGMLAKRYPTNWELSAARSVNVTRYLQDQGLDPAVLSGVAYGEYRPVGGNDTAEGRQKNRRIEIILVPKE